MSNIYQQKKSAILTLALPIERMPTLCKQILLAISLLLAFFLFSGNLFSRNTHGVNGLFKDSSGAFLTGDSVKVGNSKMDTSTCSDGKCTFHISLPATLDVSGIGFSPLREEASVIVIMENN